MLDLRDEINTALIIVLILVGPFNAVKAEKNSLYIYKTTYVLENRGDKTQIVTEEFATFPLFKNNSHQSVRMVNSTHNVAEEYFDVDENKLVVLDLPSELFPNEKLLLSIIYEFESSDQPRPDIDVEKAGKLSDIPQAIVDKYCIGTETFTTYDETVSKLASSLAANQITVLGIVIQLIDWLIGNTSYNNFEVPKYPSETLAEGKGDCDDQAILLITMCRALGIPAILQVGLVFNEVLEGEKNSWGGHLYVEQKGVGWHGWAIVYIPPWGWLPVDLTMVRSQEALSKITGAPVYEEGVITSFNVSRQEYIGSNKIAREQLMSSDLYISMFDEGRSINRNKEETGRGFFTRPEYVLVPTLCILSVLIAAVFLRSRYQRTRKRTPL